MKVGVFLRAVNLPGGRLLMSDFKRALADLGFSDAQTLLASGNAVIEAAVADRALEARIVAGMLASLGQTAEVFVRDRVALAAILAGNPFRREASEDPSRTYAMLLDGEPAEADVAALRGRITGPETVAAGPGCLYAYYPDGAGDSKLTSKAIERALKLRSTGRNWTTVSKMAALCGG